MNRLHEKQEEEARVTLLTVFACEQDFRGAPAAGGWGVGEDGKRKESLQLRRWNLNSTSNSLLLPVGLSCQISANQRAAETSANYQTLKNTG